MKIIKFNMGFDIEKSFIMAERLKKLRDEKGLSHEKLSKALFDQYGVKISSDSLINYEVADAGHTKAYKNQGMRVEYLRCLADFYGVSADYILGQINDPCRIPSAIDELGLSEKAVEWIEGLEKKARCSDHDDRISVLNYLLENIDFQLFFYNLCEFYYSSRAEAIYNALFDLEFPRMEGDKDIVTQEMGDRFRAKLAQILDAHHIPNEIRDYLAAASDLWGRQSLGDSRLVDVLMGVEGFNVSDLPEFRVNRDFSTLMESVRQHAAEQGTIGILPEGVVESMR